MHNFNSKFEKFTKVDYIIFGIIILIYGLFSFFRLGNLHSPNTFYSKSGSNSIILDLKKEDYINKIKIFSGVRASDFTILISSDGVEYDYLRSFRNGHVFNWEIFDVSTRARYLKFDFDDETSIGEIGVFNYSKDYDYVAFDNHNHKINTLNDEKKLIPKEKSYMNSMYFDEVYFARTAYEYVYNLKTYEWTHPPLGKIIQAIPIYITHNMSPFNYRLMGNISGILLVGVMYLFGTFISKKRKYGIFAALLMALDTFHFAHTRMGTVDSHLVLFIVLSVFFMLIFINNKKYKYMFLSGLFFALCVCVKWTAFYTGIALALIYFYFLFKNKLFNIKHIGLGFLFFVFVPLLLYLSVFYVFSNNFYVTNNIHNIILENIKMFSYHSKLEATHNFSSKWYTWPISYKPVWYHYINYFDKAESISGIGNIVIWICGIIGVLYCLIKFIIKKDINCFCLLICVFSMWLPYFFINRIMFLYHYFPVLPFLFLSLMYFVYDIDVKFKIRYLMYVILLFAYVFFVFYYPVVSGFRVSNDYLNRLELFESWHFS